jgi:aminoglycoside/choline kinase family phosphotransferase
MPDDINARIASFLEETGLAATTAKVVPLTGDASDRRYFRLFVPGEASRVLAVHPGPVDFEALPFVNVARLLSAMPVPVPQIFSH